MMRGVDGVLLVDFCRACWELKWECICSDNDDMEVEVSSDDDDDIKIASDVDMGEASDDGKNVAKDKNVADQIDTTNWREFAILPYQDRRKFTLGTIFNSWEEQGDFIFLNIGHNGGYDSDSSDDEYDFGWARRTPSLVEISCTNGQYRIMPMRGTKLVINGDDRTCSCGQHHSSFRLDLNFGDRLEISVGSGPSRTLVFKERTYKLQLDLDKNAKLENSDAEQDEDFAPGRNQLILSKILSYLPIQSLKCARLVCQDWNDQGSRILRRRAFATFTCEYEDADMVEDVNASMKFYRYVQEMGDNLMPNLSLVLPKFTFGRSGFNVSEHHAGGKYVMDLDWFLHPHRGHHIKKLDLNASIDSQFDYQTCLKVVTQMQETLEELTLDMEATDLMKPNGDEAEYQTPGTLSFKKLKSFTFLLNANIPFDSDDEDDITPLNLAWLAPWASAIRNVATLTIIGHPLVSSALVKHMQTLGPSEFPNLTKVDTLHVHEAGPVLDFALGLRQPLKHLDLPDLVKMQDFRNFEKLVDKHSKSLECLVFVVSTKQDARAGLNLRLPSLPALHSLDFLVNRRSSQENGDAMVTLSFPGDEATVNYKAHLPSIRFLQVYPVNEGSLGRNWEKYGHFFDVFLPKNEICRTLTHLEIPYKMGRDQYPRAAELPGMFPNVENKFITKWREHPPRPKKPRQQTATGGGYWLRSKNHN